MAHPNEGGTPPPAEPTQEPVQAPPAQAAGTPPAGGGTTPPAPDLSARLSELEKQNAQLIDYALSLEKRTGGGEPTPPKEEPPIQVDEDVQKYIDQRESKLLGTVSSLQDQLDQMQFVATVQQTGVDVELAKKADTLYQQWRQTGFRTVDGAGRARVPSRKDALAIVAGNAMLEQGGQKATERTAASLRGLLGVDRPAGGGFGGVPSSRPDEAAIEALPLAERLKKREELLDAQGF